MDQSVKNINEKINENKQRHMFKVAEFMYNEAPKYGLIPEEMYVLGLLHDIGYIFDGWHKHEEKGSKLLKDLGFKYHKEISQHSIDIDNNIVLSKEAMLLIAADSCVDFKGNIGNYETRRKDIEDRYDISDRQFYLNRFDKRVEFLKQHGFNY